MRVPFAHEGTREPPYSGLSKPKYVADSTDKRFFLYICDWLRAMFLIGNRPGLGPTLIRLTFASQISLYLRGKVTVFSA